MTPDDLRELAHQLETGVDIIAMLERIQMDPEGHVKEFIKLRDHIVEAHIPLQAVSTMGAIFVAIASHMKGHEVAVVTATEPEGNIIDLDARR